MKKIKVKNLNSAANAVQKSKEKELTEKYFGLVKRIESFAELKKDWDTYDSEPPGEVAIKNAITALGYSQRRFPDLISPSNGGITFEYVKDHYYFVMEFCSDEYIAYLEQINGSVVKSGDIKINEVEQVIKTVIGELL